MMCASLQMLKIHIYIFAVCYAEASYAIIVISLIVLVSVMELQETLCF
jgi:hypothetical protein